MYKVFVVDDEIVVREGLRENVEWGKINLTFAGEAPDGEVALPLIQEIKPDILLTDIKMPFMDGLELSRIVRKTMPWIKVVILSGHDEFNYAKEAIGIGVADYILKPFSSKQILGAIGKVVEQIEEDKKKSRDIVLLREQLEQTRPLLCNQFLNDLLLGLVSSFEILDKCDQFGLDILAKHYMIASLRSVYPDASPEYAEYIKTEAVIADIVRNDSDVLLVKRSLEETALIFKGKDREALEESVFRLAQSIQYAVEQNTACKVEFGIGTPCARLQEIPKSYRDACSAREFQKNGIVSFSDIDAGYYDVDAIIDKTDINSLIRFGKREDIPEALGAYISSFSEKDLKSSIFAYYVFMNVIVCCGKYVNETGGDIASVLPMLAQSDKSLMKMDNVGEVTARLKDALERVIDYRESCTNGKNRDAVAKAKEFIQANYTAPALSLNTVASHVNISPSHFSTLFSQATGETFIEYLIGLRIKKAKQLLAQSGLKSSEIAYEVGYNDPHYFSFCFKKETGKTPSEYRQEKNQTEAEKDSTAACSRS